jgi:hypothetical protein
MHMLYSRYGKQRLEAEMKALFGSSLSTWVLGRAAPLGPPARAPDAHARARTHFLPVHLRPHQHTCDPVRSDGDGTLTFLDYLKCVNSPHERARESKERERERGARPLALVISHFVCASLLAPLPRNLASARPTDTPSVPAATSARLGQGHVQARTQEGGEGRAREEVA